MSYTTVGAFSAYDPATCMKLYADYDGTWIPDSICPEPTGQTGHDPPRPRHCYGGPYAMFQALKLAGQDPGITPGGPNMTNAIAAVAAKHNIPWDRDPWSVGPEICTAVILDAMSRVPCPGGLEVGCVIPPTTVPSLTAPAPPAPPSNGTRVIAGRRTLLRQIKPAPPRIVAAKDALRRVATTEAGMEPEPPPAGPPAQDLPMDDPTIRYLYIGVGVLVVGGVAAYFIMRKK